MPRTLATTAIYGHFLQPGLGPRGDASSVLAWMKKRKRELSASEQTLKQAMNGDMAEILAGKSLLLLSELLQSIGYEDVSLLWTSNLLS